MRFSPTPGRCNDGLPMKVLPRYRNWPLSAKLATLLLVASSLPLAVTAFIDIRAARQQVLATTAAGESRDAEIAQMTREKIISAGTIILLALGAGTLVSLGILRPIRAFAKASAAIIGGDLAARVDVRGGGSGEMGRLDGDFNAMAACIQTQAAALTKANDDRELRVQERIAQLVKTTKELEAEVVERRHAEEDMRKSQQLLKGIIDSSDDAIISKTMDGIITTWNHGAEKLLGYVGQETIGNNVAMLMPPERAEEPAMIMARIAKGESIDQFDTIRVCKGGRRLNISATISPIKDREGVIVGASMIARDISERMEGVTKLQAQLNRLDLLNQITRAIGERQNLPSIFQVVIRSLEEKLQVDFGCACLYDPANNALTVASVGPHSEALAKDLSLPVKATIPIDENGLGRFVGGQLVHEPDIGKVRYPFPERLAAGGLRAVVAAPLVVDSQVLGVLIAARKHANSFSSAECEFLRQLSEQVALAAHQTQLHRSLQQAYDDLHQSQQTVIHQERLRALGQMASGIAHDINNAISPVLLYSESLLEQEPNLSGRTRKYLEIIKRSIEDVANTIARLGEFYRQGEAQHVLAAVSLNELVPQVMDMTRARWSDIPQQRGIVIMTASDLQPELPVILGVASEIREALINLVFNAVDAMPQGGTLTLRTRAIPAAAGIGVLATAGRIQVEVTDTGMGMDEEARRRCLEPFFTTKGERGTGLGLAMVYGVVKRHNAEIEIVTALKRGTTMRLDFPMPVAAAAPTKTILHLKPAPLRILVVDDDQILLKSLSETLERDGHTVVAHPGGKVAIEAFCTATLSKDTGERFAVVITDLGMPYVDGLQVASAVKIAAQATPVILLTGWGQRLVAEGEVPSYVDCVLSKPPRLNDLRAALAKCCPPTPAGRT